MRYQHEDLISTDQFLRDFGMKVVDRHGDGTKDGDKIFYAGTGPDPYVFVAIKVCSSACTYDLGGNSRNL